ncbi:hypothetical protein COM97_18680 [Bacillus thuringiensis]|uniref:hypothetical protein n=1 Tax=Bacillus thuringiensis TaxID=1428 RepID=UPI000BECCDE7|nr:hypothetical protein [Bacillus thuringiensis]PEF04994.1 hypothetical protein COM97_18680 [Bacillus thuringiensis]
MEQKEVKRVARVGETIKVTVEHDSGWRGINYPLGSTWIVKEIFDKKKGLVSCIDNEFCIFASAYVVLEG